MDGLRRALGRDQRSPAAAGKSPLYGADQWLMSSPGAQNDQRPESQPQGRGDSDKAVAVEHLLEELQTWVGLIGESSQIGQTTRLGLLAGELKVLAAESGQAAVHEAAAEIEAVLLAEEAQTSAMCEKVEALILQCKQAAEKA